MMVAEQYQSIFAYYGYRTWRSFAMEKDHLANMDVVQSLRTLIEISDHGSVQIFCKYRIICFFHLSPHRAATGLKAVFRSCGFGDSVLLV